MTGLPVVEPDSGRFRLMVPKFATVARWRRALSGAISDGTRTRNRPHLASLVGEVKEQDIRIACDDPFGKR
jgi:hypothetical protein